jgi:hypothetical protein
MAKGLSVEQVVGNQRHQYLSVWYAIHRFRTNNYRPVCATATNCPSAGNPAIGYAASSGDYNADGVNNDFPTCQAIRRTPAESFPDHRFSWPLISRFPRSVQKDSKTGQFRQPNF